MAPWVVKVVGSEKWHVMMKKGALACQSQQENFSKHNVMVANNFH